MTCNIIGAIVTLKKFVNLLQWVILEISPTGHSQTPRTKHS